MSVHQECYFNDVVIDQFEKSGEFVCFACQAVGKTFEVRICCGFSSDVLLSSSLMLVSARAVCRFNPQYQLRKDQTVGETYEVRVVLRR